MTKAAELAKIGEVATNSQIGGRRNIAYNGAMNVAQRATSVTGLGAADAYHTVDRFLLSAGNTAGRLTASQTADGPSGFANCLKLDCTTADTSIAAGERLIVRQSFEGQDVQQIKKGTSDAEKVTVSFYVKGNATATYTCELADEDNDRYVAQEFSVTTSWTKIVKTFVADTTGAFNDDNAHSMSLNIWLHAGSSFTGGTFASNTVHTTANQRVGDNQTSFFDSTDRTFFITGVQLEVGSIATPFEHRSFGEELALCQRYYQQVGGAGNSLALGQAFSGTAAHYFYQFVRQLRADATLTVSNVAHFRVFNATISGIPTTTNITFAATGSAVNNACRIVATVSSGLAAGNATHLFGDDASSNAGLFQIDAEL